MKNREIFAAGALCASLFQGACSESLPDGFVNESVLQEHNEALSEARLAAFEKLSNEFFAKLGDSNDPEIEQILELVSSGFIYAEPSNFLSDKTETEDRGIKLIPYFPDDALLGYESIEKFQDSGMAVYFDHANTILVDVSVPIELQAVNLAHELTHAIQDNNNIHSVACETREPEAFWVQAKAFEYVFDDATISTLRRFSEQIQIHDDYIDYGDITEAQKIVDSYSPDEKVRGLMFQLSDAFAIRAAAERQFGEEDARIVFDKHLSSTYCASLPA